MADVGADAATEGIVVPRSDAKDVQEPLSVAEHVHAPAASSTMYLPLKATEEIRGRGWPATSDTFTGMHTRVPHIRTHPEKSHAHTYTHAHAHARTHTHFSLTHTHAPHTPRCMLVV